MKRVSELEQKQEWKEAFMDFTLNPRGILLFAGRNGTGKTFSSEAIYDSISLPIHQDKMFITQVDLFMRWQKDIREWGNATFLYDQIQQAKLFVLDDLGTRMPSESFKDYLYAVIEKRERNKHEKGTIITTNLNAEQMREMFGDAIVSRLASGKVFRFEGKDRRFKNL